MSGVDERPRGEERAGQPEAPAEDGLRRVEPTGALVVGRPPVPVALVLRAAAGRDADAREAFPGLDEQQRATALAVDLDEAAPPPSLRDALALAVSLGLGAQLAATGLAVGLMVVLGAVLGPHLAEKAGMSLPVLWDPGPTGLAVALPVCLGLAGLGRSLTRQQPVARGIAAVLLALLTLALVAAATDSPAALLFVPTSLGLGVGLFATRALRWGSAEGRLALSALPTRGYVAAVTWLHVLATVLVLFVPAFVALCGMIGHPLRPSAAAVAWLSAVLSRTAWLWWPLSLLLPVPLLRVAARREQPAYLGAALLGLFAVGSTIGALVQTILDML